MEQRDYLLREIEKIGILLRAIRERLFGGGEKLSITIEKQFEDTKEMLLNDIHFDLDLFLQLNAEDAVAYLSQFKGFNIDNIEQLARIISPMGFENTSHQSKIYLEKALQLYEFCELTDKTYSVDREVNLNRIKNALQE